jgi:hypothetical protein
LDIGVFDRREEGYIQGNGTSVDSEDCLSWGNGSECLPSKLTVLELRISQVDVIGVVNSDDSCPPFDTTGPETRPVPRKFIRWEPEVGVRITDRKWEGWRPS